MTTPLVLPMRIFEVIYVGLLLISVSLCLHAQSASDLSNSLHWNDGLLLGACIVALVHARLEGLHWQMAFAYLAIVPVALARLSPTAQEPLAWLAFTALTISLVMSALLPMFKFEPCKGPYQVGTSLHHLVDPTRVEEERSSTSYPRELMIQIWYPATPSRHPWSEYRRRRETTRLSSYQAVLKTQARWNAPPHDIEKPLPVLVFHPAWNGRRTQNTFLTQDLASRGFFVVAVDHTYNSEPIAFPDGRVLRARHVPAIEDVASSTADEVRSIGNAEVLRQAADNCFVLDTLATWNKQKGSPWFQKLDTTACGILGHSLGGAVAVECLRFDQRVCAAMNMDGWTFGTPVNQPEVKGRLADSSPEISRALLFFQEEHRLAPHPEAGTSTVEAELNAWDLSNTQHLLETFGGYRFQLLGANHLNFTDRPISSPLRRLSGGGPINARQAHRILREVTASFFSQALLGAPADWLETPSERYAEIRPLALSGRPSEVGQA